MKRKIIKIDAEKCNGCRLCISACHEGAIGIKDGKAVLLRDDYCDGLGACLPVCPTKAISFEEREAQAFDEAAVKERMEMKERPLPCGCPGMNVKSFKDKGSEDTGGQPKTVSHLGQWPVQIKLVPVNAPYFDGANLLIAADCSAYAYGGFHKDFMRKRITLIGCPKLDDVDYTDKLKAILTLNDIKSIMVVRMEVPCCGGIEHAVKAALSGCGKMIPWQVVTVSTAGEILD